MNNSILFLDSVSSFPRDQVSFALRINSSLNNTSSVGPVRICAPVTMYGGRDLVWYVEQLSSGALQIPNVSDETGSFCAYICVGYSDALAGVQSPQISKDALKYIASFLDRLGWTLKLVLPVIRSNRLAKDQKMHFAHIHGAIREIVEEYDFAETIKVPLVATDPTSPRGESIVELANALAHDIAVRSINEVVKKIDRPEIIVLRTASRTPAALRFASTEQDTDTKTRPNTQDRIIITEEAPIARRRRK